MERKTINYYRQALAKGYNESVIKEIVSKYGVNGRIWLGKAMPFHRNHRINSVSVDKDVLWLNVYWQGDSTDGDNSIRASELRSRNEYVIPARHEFECGRTYEVHSDIVIRRDELSEINEAMKEYLSPDAVKERKEEKLYSNCNARVHQYTHNKLYKQYAGSIWSADERWFNGIKAVDKYTEIHYNEMLKLDESRLHEVVKAVFLANYQYDRDMPKSKPENGTCKAPIIYDLSYQIKVCE